jgi:hypothetical protein
VSECGPRFRDIDQARVVVGRWPNGASTYAGIWARRFVGVKVEDNPDGTIKVQVYGSVSGDDFAQKSVFRK